MKAEDKQLIFKDISSRLIYKPKAYVRHWSNIDRKYYEGVYTIESVHPLANIILVTSEKGSVEVILGYYDYEFKPYLIPMVSLPENKVHEFYCRFVADDIPFDDFVAYYWNTNSLHKLLTAIDDVKSIMDWYNENHVDCHGFIYRDLANDATNLSIY